MKKPKEKQLYITASPELFARWRKLEAAGFLRTGRASALVQNDMAISVREVESVFRTIEREATDRLREFRIEFDSLVVATRRHIKAPATPAERL